MPIMKKNFTLCLAMLFSLLMNAQITYTDYGEGWIVPMAASAGFDVDEDGTDDFIINQFDGELGLSPVFVVGCISAPAAGATVDFGAYEMSTFGEGDNIQATNANLFDYIDDGRGGAYHRDFGFVDGFEAEEDVYLGFILMKGAMVHNGWMKVSFDDAAETTTIKEIAYGPLVLPDAPGIAAGDNGLNSVGLNDLSDEVTDLTVAPNPAEDFFNISFEYKATDVLNVGVYNAIGQLVQQVSTASSAGKHNMIVNTLDWNAGLYMVRLQSDKGIKTQKIYVK